MASLKNNYQLHIITNGFEEVQYQKLKSNNLLDYFNVIITSEQAGYKKPNPDIFNYAFTKCRAHPKDSLMIGDDLVADIAGAREVGMNQVFLILFQSLIATQLLLMKLVVLASCLIYCKTNFLNFIPKIRKRFFYCVNTL